MYINIYFSFIYGSERIASVREGLLELIYIFSAGWRGALKFQRRMFVYDFVDTNNLWAEMIPAELGFQNI